jgi:DNA-directed RNA polymerase subunit RPC12/RpoP
MAIGAGVTLFQGFLYDPLGKELTTQLVVGGMVLIAATFYWAGQNIVCPQCKLKLLYYSITKVGLGTWYVWLLSEEKCPECGYSGQPTPESKGRRKSK